MKLRIGLLAILLLQPMSSLAQDLAEQQIVHKGNGAEPQSLDPHKAEGVPSSNIQRDLYEGLVSETPSGDLIPGAALRWEISEDGTVYTFSLRPKAQWSNGDPVTAQDFVFGLRRSADPATLSNYSQILSSIENAEDVIAGKRPPEELGAKAINDLTLEITLKAPTPYFLGLLTHSSTYPVNRRNVEEFGNRFARPGNLVSNGAYVLKDWVVQSHIELVRNPLYWDNTNTTVDTVFYHATEDQSSALKRFRAGEIHYVYEVPTGQVEWIRENMPDEFVVATYLGSYYFGFNMTRPPFKDNHKLRRALTMGIDREILVDKVTKLGERPAYSWIPDGISQYTAQVPEWATWSKQKQLEEARKLYREAGYGPDNPLRIEIRYNTNENHKKVAIAVAAMWKQSLGVLATLVNQEWKVFLETRKQKRVTEVFRGGWIGDYNDAFTFAELMHSKHGINDPGYNNPRYDELMHLASVEGDFDRRRELLQQAERLMLEDQPIMPIYFYVSKHMVSKKVDGYVSNIMDHHYTKNWRLLK
ncbi:MAG: peptide ABC transporter substrate-binding protein [Oceanococcus sp.]